MKVAVIGVGIMGKHHTRIYSSLPGIKLVGVADINESEGNLVAKKYHTKFYKDYMDLIDKEKPDALSICVPTSQHYIVAKDCLQKKCNILLEKPITRTLEEARKLQLSARENKTTFMIGHIERHNPAVKKVKEMIVKGDLGKITAIMLRRLGGFPPQIKDANITVDLAIHDIDVANFLMEDLPYDIAINKQKHHIKLREDSVEFFLKYKKASVYIQANWISPVKIRKLNITGTDGYLEMDYITQKIEFYKSNYNKFRDATKDYSDYILLFSEPDQINISVAKKEPLREELIYFLDAVANKKNINIDHAIHALKIALSH